MATRKKSKRSEVRPEALPELVSDGLFTLGEFARVRKIFLRAAAERLAKRLGVDQPDADPDLAELYARALEREDLARDFKTADLVFAGETGALLDDAAIRRDYFHPIAKAAGLPESTRMYDARHTFASLALSAGVPIHEVSRILGHSTVTLTLNTYSHLLPDRASAATDAVGSAIFGG